MGVEAATTAAEALPQASRGLRCHGFSQDTPRRQKSVSPRKNSWHVLGDETVPLTSLAASSSLQQSAVTKRIVLDFMSCWIHRLAITALTMIRGTSSGCAD